MCCKTGLGLSNLHDIVARYDQLAGGVAEAEDKPASRQRARIALQEMRDEATAGARLQCRAEHSHARRRENLVFESADHSAVMLIAMFAAQINAIAASCVTRIA
jgi:hypothetical protein